MPYCYFNIHVRGEKQAVLAFYSMTKRSKYLTIEKEFEDADNYVMYFSGYIYDPKDLYGSEYRKTTSIDAHELTEEQIRNGECMVKHMGLSLRQKSELLGLDVQVHSWSKVQDFSQLEYYKRGFFVNVIYDTCEKGNDYEFNF